MFVLYTGARTGDAFSEGECMKKLAAVLMSLALMTLGVGTASAATGTEDGKKAQAAINSAALKNSVWPEWKKFRTEQVNTLMSEIRSAVNKAKPGLPISSYVWGYNTYLPNYETNQDWMTWIKNGWLDWINPSGYRYNDADFIKAVDDNRSHIAKTFPFYVTIATTSSSPMRSGSYWGSLTHSPNNPRFGRARHGRGRSSHSPETRTERSNSAVSP
jgi:hypothetical protein